MEENGKNLQKSVVDENLAGAPTLVRRKLEAYPIKLYPDEIVRFREFCESYSESNGGRCTIREVLLGLMDLYENPRVEKVVDPDMSSRLESLERSLEKKEQELGHFRGIIKKAEMTINELNARNDELKAEKLAMSQELVACRSDLAKREEGYRLVEENYSRVRGMLPKEDEVLVSMTKEEHLLLTETCMRLSKRYGRDVVASDLFRKMFMRYTVERCCEWFYPFVVSDRELQDMTGKSRQEWKDFFKG